ncbi:MAG: DUF4435 domain-containing protein [Syntrophobacteraceae bacterium]
MIEDLTAHDIAAEAEMVRAAFGGTLLFLEGSSDFRLFERFIDTVHCRAIIAFGKENAIGAVQILESRRFAGVIAIVDADLARILGQTCPSSNVALTDPHDIELMLLQAYSFEAVISEYASESKVTRFLERFSVSDLRGILLDRSLPIGILRLISQEEELNLKFKGVKFKNFVDASSLIVDVCKMVNAVVNNTEKTGIHPNNLISKIVDKIKDLKHDRYQLCSGHDVMEILAIGLRKAFGSQVEAIACRTNVESILRLAYEMRHFIRKDLYAQVRQWEMSNAPYIVFMVP